MLKKGALGLGLMLLALDEKNFKRDLLEILKLHLSKKQTVYVGRVCPFVFVLK
jgi:hypothetical protein